MDENQCENFFPIGTLTTDYTVAKNQRSMSYSTKFDARQPEIILHQIFVAPLSEKVTWVLIAKQSILKESKRL